MADARLLEFEGRALRLDRFPMRRDEPMRAWDAADEYLLADFAGVAPGGRTLLAHDAFGALACALHPRRTVCWSDSFLARKAVAYNHQANALDWDPTRFVRMDHEPDGRFDLVLVKIPKGMGCLEDTLRRLRPILAPGARVVTAGMIKHVPMRAWRLLEEIIGPARTSRGWKKARYAVAEYDPDRDRPARLEPAVWTWGDPPLTIRSSATVFAREGLDHGTRLLLAHLPRRDEPLRAADLGCGNGILALALARACPRAEILAVDESFQAVRDARGNAAAAGLADRITGHVGDGLATVPAGSLDLVVCNPPFHQDHAVGDHLAWRMMNQARRALAPGGELRMVGNRHLGYHAKLGRLFGRCRPVASDRRFVVLSAVKSS